MNIRKPLYSETDLGSTNLSIKAECERCERVVDLEFGARCNAKAVKPEAGHIYSFSSIDLPLYNNNNNNNFSSLSCAILLVYTVGSSDDARLPAGAKPRPSVSLEHLGESRHQSCA